MADLDLSELERLEKAATPGPWEGPWGDTRTVAAFEGELNEHSLTNDPRGDAFPVTQETQPNDAALIAALRNALPELLRRLRAAEADAERWKYLESLQCNQFILSKNEDNASNYTTAKEWIEEFCPDDFTDTPEEEIQRMKETNTIWRLQIYPDTPIGFCVFFGATLQAAIDAARKP